MEPPFRSPSFWDWVLSFMGQNFHKNPLKNPRALSQNRDSKFSERSRKYIFDLFLKIYRQILFVHTLIFSRIFMKIFEFLRF